MPPLSSAIAAKFAFATKSPNPILITTVLALGSFALLHATSRKETSKIIKSPLSSLLPFLTEEEKGALPYPPDAFPGGRDVQSPVSSPSYGSTRVYEWGPEDGRKVILIHGITTSSVALGSIAHGLVDRGCRVMLVDLWGRGYTDTPADLEHDERLYTTQILLAVTSSPLPWTGEEGFSIVGYSLGGGISASFASYFPNLVNSLVLLVPAGLIREHRMKADRLTLSVASHLPSSFVKMLLKRRFPEEASIKSAIEPNEVNENKSLPSLASRKYPHVTERKSSQWQIDAHQGFITSLLSAGKYAPGSGQQESWKRLKNLRSNVLIIAGSSDPLIHAEELREDVYEILGEEKLVFKVFDGSHDISNTKSREIVDEICGFWGL